MRALFTMRNRPRRLKIATKLSMGSLRGLFIFPLILLCAADSSPKVIDLPGDRLFPENLSIGHDGVAYVGSIYGGVLRVALRTGKSKIWIKPGTYGSGSLFGVLADPRNAMLWVCSNNLSRANIAIAGAGAVSALIGFDLRTGAGRVSLPLPGERPLCNDIAVGSNGAVYVTDTSDSRILRWQPGSTGLTSWLTDPQLGSGRGGGLDGIAFGGDGNLYVNSFKTGELFRIILAGGQPGDVIRLKPSRPLVKADGMRPLGGTAFVLVEGAGRLNRVTVTADNAKVETIADNIREPTGVDTIGHIAWYVQGQLSVALNSEKRTSSPPEPFRMTPVSLSVESSTSEAH